MVERCLAFVAPFILWGVGAHEDVRQSSVCPYALLPKTIDSVGYRPSPHQVYLSDIFGILFNQQDSNRTGHNFNNVLNIDMLPHDGDALLTLMTEVAPEEASKVQLEVAVLEDSSANSFFSSFFQRQKCDIDEYSILGRAMPGVGASSSKSASFGQVLLKAGRRYAVRINASNFGSDSEVWEHYSTGSSLCFPIRLDLAINYVKYSPIFHLSNYGSSCFTGSSPSTTKEDLTLSQARRIQIGQRDERYSYRITSDPLVYKHTLNVPQLLHSFVKIRVKLDFMFGLDPLKVVVETRPLDKSGSLWSTLFSGSASGKPAVWTHLAGSPTFNGQYLEFEGGTGLTYSVSVVRSSVTHAAGHEYSNHLINARYLPSCLQYQLVASFEYEMKPKSKQVHRVFGSGKRSKCSFASLPDVLDLVEGQGGGIGIDKVSQFSNSRMGHKKAIRGTSIHLHDVFGLHFISGDMHHLTELNLETAGVLHAVLLYTGTPNVQVAVALKDSEGVVGDFVCMSSALQPSTALPLRVDGDVDMLCLLGPGNYYFMMVTESKSSSCPQVFMDLHLEPVTTINAYMEGTVCQQRLAHLKIDGTSVEETQEFGEVPVKWAAFAEQMPEAPLLLSQTVSVTAAEIEKSPDKTVRLYVRAHTYLSFHGIFMTVKPGKEDAYYPVKVHRNEGAQYFEVFFTAPSEVVFQIYQRVGTLYNTPEILMCFKMALIIGKVTEELVTASPVAPASSGWFGGWLGGSVAPTGLTPEIRREIQCKGLKAALPRSLTTYSLEDRQKSSFYPYLLNVPGSVHSDDLFLVPESMSHTIRLDLARPTFIKLFVTADCCQVEASLSRDSRLLATTLNHFFFFAKDSGLYEITLKFLPKQEYVAVNGECPKTHLILSMVSHEGVRTCGQAGLDSAWAAGRDAISAGMKTAFEASSGVVEVNTELPLAPPSSRAAHVSDTSLSHNANVDPHAVFEFKFSIHDSASLSLDFSFSPLPLFPLQIEVSSEEETGSSVHSSTVSLWDMTRLEVPLNHLNPGNYKITLEYVGISEDDPYLVDNLKCMDVNMAIQVVAAPEPRTPKKVKLTSNVRVSDSIQPVIPWKDFNLNSIGKLHPSFVTPPVGWTWWLLGYPQMEDMGATVFTGTFLLAGASVFTPPEADLPLFLRVVVESFDDFTFEVYDQTNQQSLGIFKDKVFGFWLREPSTYELKVLSSSQTLDADDQLPPTVVTLGVAPVHTIFSAHNSLQTYMDFELKEKNIPTQHYVDGVLCPNLLTGVANLKVDPKSWEYYSILSVKTPDEAQILEVFQLSLDEPGVLTVEVGSQFLGTYASIAGIVDSSANDLLAMAFSHQKASLNTFTIALQPGDYLLKLKVIPLPRLPSRRAQSSGWFSSGNAEYWTPETFDKENNIKCSTLSIDLIVTSLNQMGSIWNGHVIKMAHLQNEMPALPLMDNSERLVAFPASFDSLMQNEPRFLFRGLIDLGDTQRIVPVGNFNEIRVRGKVQGDFLLRVYTISTDTDGRVGVTCSQRATGIGGGQLQEILSHSAYEAKSTSPGRETLWIIPATVTGSVYLSFEANSPFEVMVGLLPVADFKTMRGTCDAIEHPFQRNSDGSLPVGTGSPVESWVTQSIFPSIQAMNAGSITGVAKKKERRSLPQPRLGFGLRIPLTLIKDTYVDFSVGYNFFLSHLELVVHRAYSALSSDSTRVIQDIVMVGRTDPVYGLNSPVNARLVVEGILPAGEYELVVVDDHAQDEGGRSGVIITHDHAQPMTLIAGDSSTTPAAAQVQIHDLCYPLEFNFRIQPLTTENIVNIHPDTDSHLPSEGPFNFKIFFSKPTVLCSSANLREIRFGNTGLSKANLQLAPDAHSVELSFSRDDLAEGATTANLSVPSQIFCDRDTQSMGGYPMLSLDYLFENPNQPLWVGPSTPTSPFESNEKSTLKRSPKGLRNLQKPSPLVATPLTPTPAPLVKGVGSMHPVTSNFSAAPQGSLTLWGLLTYLFYFGVLLLILGLVLSKLREKAKKSRTNDVEVEFLRVEVDDFDVDVSLPIGLWILRGFRTSKDAMLTHKEKLTDWFYDLKTQVPHWISWLRNRRDPEYMELDVPIESAQDLEGLNADNLIAEIPVDDFFAYQESTDFLDQGPIE